MKIRNYEKLCFNLPQLQDKIKRDKESYHKEVSYIENTLSC